MVRVSVHLYMVYFHHTLQDWSHTEEDGQKEPKHPRMRRVVKYCLLTWQGHRTHGFTVGCLKPINIPDGRGAPVSQPLVEELLVAGGWWLLRDTSDVSSGLEPLVSFLYFVK